MVKKSSLLSKLKNRLKVGPEQGDRLGPLPARPATATSSRKLSNKQEALMAVGEGFKELSNMMRGVQVRLEDQDARMAEVADNTRGQLTALNGLSSNLEQLPEAMRELRKALDRSAATDERTGRTLKDFQSNMEKIQGSMDKMVEHSGNQARATRSLTDRREEQERQQTVAIRGMVRDLGTAQDAAVGRMAEANGEHLDSLRNATEDQSARLLKLMSASGKWNRAMLVVMILLLGGCAALFGLQVFA